MIIEYTYTPQDLAKKCYGCTWLKMRDNWDGKCVCPDNKVKFRQRSVTDKACSFKTTQPPKGE